MAEKIADCACNATDRSYIASRLRVERERSKLALDELTFFMEGETYTKMKRHMCELSVTL